MHQMLQRNRLIYLLVAISILVVLLVWFARNLMHIREAPAKSRLQLAVPIVASDSLVQLTSENTSEAYIDGVQQRNIDQAHRAQARGMSHVDRLVNGVQLLDSSDTRAFDDLQGQLQGLVDAQAAMQGQLQRLNKQRAVRNVSNKDVLPFYTALTGVQHLSEDFASIEQAAIANAIDVVSVSSKGVSVGLIANLVSIADPSRARSTAALRQRTEAHERRAPALLDDVVEVISASEAVLHARLNLGLNTDIGGIASATVVGGRLHGTVLTASSYSAKRRHLAINFDRFCTVGGLCGDVRAVAVDLDEGVAAIKGEYQGNYGIRFGGSIAASILEGYGRAVSAGIGTDSLLVDGRIIRTQAQDVSSKQAFKASALEAGNTLGQFFREFAARPPLVSKDINELIGVYIIEPGVWRGSGVPARAFIPTKTTK